MHKDYNSKMAIGVGDDPVKFVYMGSMYISTNENNHLLTYGLGPCVGVSIVIKSGDNDVTRFLAHMDMGQLLGASFKDLKYKIQKLKSDINDPIKQIDISLVTTQSYINMNYLNDREAELLAIILKEFEQFGITINDINFVYSSQVQISPSGEIRTYTQEEQEEHKEYMRMLDIYSFGGYIHEELNIYITDFGAYMGNCSLNADSSIEEKESLLTCEYWQKYIEDGYKLVIAPSFNDPNSLAVYVANWNDTNIHKYGTIPGCWQASVSPRPKKHFRL